jgi:heat shock protein HtpX
MAAASIVALGGLLGGTIGVLVAVGFGSVSLGAAWWISDWLVLRAAGARPLDARTATGLDKSLADLSLRAAIPTPRCYVVSCPQPNAFSVGRSPRHASVVVTDGLLSLLEPAEIRAVLAREVVHIRRRDTFMTTVAGAVLSQIFGAISLARTYVPPRRRGEAEHPHDGRSVGPRMAKVMCGLPRRSRREWSADRDGSDLCRDLEAMIRALQRMDRYAGVVPMEIALAHVSNWVVNPLGGDRRVWLFATIPTLQDRIERLLGARPTSMAT